MSDISWPQLLNEMMDRANVRLQQGDRKGSAIEMAKAAEVLFTEAAKAETLEKKKRLAHRAGQMLETSLMLRDSTVATSCKTHKDAHTDATAAPVFSRGKPLTFADIAGLVEVKQTLMQRVVYPFRHPEKLEKYRISTGGGMLLYGPPGTGKTLLARAVAGELGLPFYVIKSSEVLGQYYGQSEKQLAELFEQARNEPNGAVVFLDEIDAIGSQRTEQMHEASRRLLTQLLQELDGVDGRSRNLVFLAATNEPWLLDAALLRPPRFCEKCYVPLPDAPARQVLFAMNLKQCPLADDLSIARLVEHSDGLSGADIVNLCERAKLIPFCESIDSGEDRPISAADFEQAMRNVRPSVGRQLLKRFESWTKSS